MQRACPICSRDDRADIENAILNMTSSGRNRSIEQIAEEFGVEVDKLKFHAMFHTPLVDVDDLEDDVETEAPKDSLAKQMRLKEADVLTEATNEYMITLKAAGRRINRLLGVKDTGVAGDDDDQAFRLSKMLTKPMVDLYLGLGGEIRANVKTMADINRMINGPQDDTASGLAALANAIRGSDTE